MVTSVLFCSKKSILMTLARYCKTIIQLIFFNDLTIRLIFVVSGYIILFRETLELEYVDKMSSSMKMTIFTFLLPVRRQTERQSDT